MLRLLKWPIWFTQCRILLSRRVLLSVPVKAVWCYWELQSLNHRAITVNTHSSQSTFFSVHCYLRKLCAQIQWLVRLLTFSSTVLWISQRSCADALLVMNALSVMPTAHWSEYTWLSLCKYNNVDIMYLPLAQEIHLLEVLYLPALPEVPEVPKRIRTHTHSPTKSLSLN